MRNRLAASLLLVIALIGVLSLLRREPALTPPPSAPVPEQALLVKAQGTPQARNLSCESRSASDLARYWGFDVDENEFLARLPRADNPHRGFVGSPDDERGGLPPQGYGVYAEPVAALLREYGLPARVETGRDVEWLRREVGAGRPVIVWSTYGFKAGPVQKLKDRRGQEFEAVQWEHTYLVVGYSPHGFHAIDAYDAERDFFTLAEFEAGWNLLGRMAVAVDDPAAVRVASGGLGGALANLGIPLLSMGLLAAAYVTWRTGGKRPALRPRRKVGHRVPHSVGVTPPAPGLSDRFLATLDRILQDWSRTDDSQELDYGLAQTLGAIGLALGMFVTLSLGGFNPFVGIPLVLISGALGFVSGVVITRRRS